MASAAEIKERGSSSSIQELSVVDVPLPNLNILELSTDSSTLAATADANIHFFSVDSLLDKVRLLGFTSSFSFYLYCVIGLSRWIVAFWRSSQLYKLYCLFSII